MNFPTDITMTLELKGSRSLRPFSTQVASGMLFPIDYTRVTIVDSSKCFITRGTNTGAMMGAAHVVTTSVGMCDVDLR